MYFNVLGVNIRSTQGMGNVAPVARMFRMNVNQTTAALAVLMDPDGGLPPLMRRAVKAAADRGRELGK